VGRKPVPTALKVLKGTDQPCRTNKKEPKLKAQNLAVPAHVTGKARWCWRRLVKVIGPMRVMTKADAVALEEAAYAYADLLQTREVLEEQGYTYESETEDGRVLVRRRPEVEIHGDAWRRLEKMITHFGISPSSRTKVSTLEGSNKKKDPFELL